jgi:hypothetical protein
MELVNRFQLQDDLSRDQEVDAGSPDRYALEGHVDRILRLEGYGPMRQ